MKTTTFTARPGLNRASVIKTRNTCSFIVLRLVVNAPDLARMKTLLVHFGQRRATVNKSIRITCRLDARSRVASAKQLL